jgi:hypothetical protein
MKFAIAVLILGFSVNGSAQECPATAESMTDALNGTRWGNCEAGSKNVLSYVKIGPNQLHLTAQTVVYAEDDTQCRKTPEYTVDMNNYAYKITINERVDADFCLWNTAWNHMHQEVVNSQVTPMRYMGVQEFLIPQFDEMELTGSLTVYRRDYQR